MRPLRSEYLPKKGCSSEPSKLILVYPDQASFDRAATLELYLREETICASLRASLDEPRLTTDPHSDAPKLGELAVGAVAILARVRDGECLLFLDGCLQW